MILWVLILCSVMIVNADVLPSYINVCNKTNLDLEFCLKDSIETLRARLVNGIPEFNITSMEPLEIADIILSEAVNSKGLMISSHEIKVYGALSFMLRNISVIEHARKYKISMYIPNFSLVGTYKSEGLLFSTIPLKGHGRFAGNFSGGVGELDITFAIKMIKGTSRIRVSKLDYQLTAKNGRLSLENLFLGRDPAISDLVNQMINANFKQYSDITLPLVSQEMSRVLKRNANKILVKFTEEQLFP